MLNWHTIPDQPDQAPALVCFHGFLGNALDWLPLVEALDPPGPCLCLDLPGHGKSGTVAWEFWDEFIDAIAADLEGRRLPPVPLLGYSMGGRVALHLALRHPRLFSALVLESASPGLRTEEERVHRHIQDQQLGARIARLLAESGEDHAAYESFLREWYAQPLFHTLARNQIALNQLIKKRSAAPPAQPGEALRLLGVGAQPSLWEALPALDIPTLVIVGEEDRKYRLLGETMSECCPRIALEVFANCSHNVHLENLAGYTTVLRRFLHAVC